MNTGKQINVMVVVLLLLLTVVGAYTIWDPFRAEAEAERIQKDMAERAASTYAAQCRACHGNQGEGRIGPALNPEFRERAGLTSFADPEKLVENRSLVTNILRCGRIGTIMPAWAQDQGGPLNEEQIRRLVILITEAPEGSWEAALHEAEHLEEEGVELAPVAEITASASITGAGNPVCGQRAPATPEVPATPAEFKQEWTVVATDNKFDVNAIGINANQPATITLRNSGNALHNIHVQGVRGTNNQEITTPLRPGNTTETITFTIATPGTYKYICDAHPTEMVGNLVVQ